MKNRNKLGSRKRKGNKKFIELKNEREKKG
jgi:hypothetical protein